MNYERSYRINDCSSSDSVTDFLGGCGGQVHKIDTAYDLVWTTASVVNACFNCMEVCWVI